jgi:hypothetical protein
MADTTITDTVDPTAPFDAAQYFKTLFDWGMAPYAREWEGEIWIGQSVNGPDEMEMLFLWAKNCDPDGKLRAEHARALWERRAVDVPCVPLGLG